LLLSAYCHYNCTQKKSLLHVCWSLICTRLHPEEMAKNVLLPHAGIRISGNLDRPHHESLTSPTSPGNNFFSAARVSVWPIHVSKELFSQAFGIPLSFVCHPASQTIISATTAKDMGNCSVSDVCICYSKRMYHTSVCGVGTCTFDRSLRSEPEHKTKTKH